MILEFSRQNFERIMKNQISCKSVQWERTDGRTYRQMTDRQIDMTKLIIPFREFANTPKDEFYLYGSVHRWSILRIAQRDAIQSSLFIILQFHWTCFGFQPHPSSGVHKTVTTASGTGHIFVQLPPSNMTKLAWPRWREVAAQYRRL